jgi:hypothetical protein
MPQAAVNAPEASSGALGAGTACLTARAELPAALDAEAAEGK